jgi:hypothetical protein
MWEKVGEWLTWGRIIAAAVLAAAGFGTFVAGEIAGAASLEPRVTALEQRAEVIEARMSAQNEVLAEIRGYVRGIAARVGAAPMGGSRE